MSPVRALFAFVNEVGKAIGTALGLDGVNAAFELEKGFQAVLGTVEKLGTFIIGLGTRIGSFVGGVLTNVVQAGQKAATRLAEIFGGVFGRTSEGSFWLMLIRICHPRSRHLLRGLSMRSVVGLQRLLKPLAVLFLKPLMLAQALPLGQG